MPLNPNHHFDIDELESRLRDLLEQATREKSHYYVAHTVVAVLKFLADVRAERTKARS